MQSMPIDFHDRHKPMLGDVEHTPAPATDSDTGATSNPDNMDSIKRLDEVYRMLATMNIDIVELQKIPCKQLSQLRNDIATHSILANNRDKQIAELTRTLQAQRAEHSAELVHLKETFTGQHNKIIDTIVKVEEQMELIDRNHVILNHNIQKALDEAHHIQEQWGGEDPPCSGTS